MSRSPDPRQPFRLTPVAEAVARLTAPLHPVAAEVLAVEAAVGCALAEPIRAPGPVPPRAVALRDGWAVAAADTVGASSYTPVMLNGVQFVLDGAELPVGHDAVLPLDTVSIAAGHAEVMASAAPGEGARRAGEDARAGTVLRAAGACLRTRDAAIARAIGVESCAVRRARVRVIGGSAASDLLAHFAEAAGAAVTRGGLENPDLTDTDLLVVVGASDTAAVLPASAEAAAPALALRPGEGVGCRLAGAVPIVTSPDRLEIALAAALVLLRPCLERLQAMPPERPALSAPLTRKLASIVGLTELALLRETNGGLEPLAVGDITLTAMAQADAWLAVPPESEGFPAGATVRAFVL